MKISKINEELEQILERDGYMSNGEVHFATKEAEILWQNEVLGQLSDGHWENATPRHHYDFWYDAQVIVDGQIGYKGNPSKTNYNPLSLLSPSFEITNRMLSYIAAIRLNKDPDLAEYVVDWANKMKNPGEDKYWLEVSQKVKNEFGEDIDKAREEILQAASVQDVKTALKEIKQMFRTKLN